MYDALLASTEFTYSMLNRRCRTFDMLMRAFYAVCVSACVLLFSLRRSREMPQMCRPFIPASSFEERGSQGNLTFHCGLPQIKIELSCVLFKSPFNFFLTGMKDFV